MHLMSTQGCHMNTVIKQSDAGGAPCQEVCDDARLSYI